jgi:hypothetical protein
VEKSCIWNIKPVIKEQAPPKTWEEFCKMNDLKIPYNFEQRILDVVRDHTTAEAVIALMRLILLRNAYNGDWVPDWNDNGRKYVIEFFDGEIVIDYNVALTSTSLYFKSEQLRDEFLCYFRPLIEKLKPLYGIKSNN